MQVVYCGVKSNGFWDYNSQCRAIVRRLMTEKEDDRPWRPSVVVGMMPNTLVVSGDSIVSQVLLLPCSEFYSGTASKHAEVSLCWIVGSYRL